MVKKNRNGMTNGRRKPAKQPQAVPARVWLAAGRKSIEELAKEQGKELRPWTDEDFKQLAETGKGLWKNDEELDEFLKGIYQRRRQERER